MDRRRRHRVAGRGGGQAQEGGENILVLPASDWSVVRIYPCFLRLIVRPEYRPRRRCEYTRASCV
eukprot:7361288-Pyramimonas_sp.AAC.2